MIHATPARSYREFTAHWGARQRFRSAARDAAVALLSLRRSIAKTSRWIGFPYYHHVFDDERAGFARQLKYMRRFGEFISLDDALSLLESCMPIDGRYFCITFDDGFRNVITNAAPITNEHKVPLAVFIATSFIAEPGNENQPRGDFFEYEGAAMEFLSWNQVRALHNDQCTIGSHTVSHLRLKGATESHVVQELNESRTRIEAETGAECRHFCVPYGRPNFDFDPAIHVKLAAQAGYRSFLTTRRGLNRRAAPGDPIVLNRDHMLASWNLAQVRYFFGA